MSISIIILYLSLDSFTSVYSPNNIIILIIYTNKDTRIAYTSYLKESYI
jgi:hypothetical protein